MTIRPRDMQKWKLYRAEREAFADLPLHPRLALSHEIEAFLRAVEPNASFHVVLSARGRTSRAQWWTGRIAIAPVHRNKRWVWVHELAHIILADHDVAAHGREFARQYLALVEHAFGVSWRDRLAACFDRAGVRWRAKKAIGPARMAQLQAQGRRLAALRQARVMAEAEELEALRVEIVTRIVARMEEQLPNR